jgi:glyoxylase-like metal-dependent hydrolase (beta-lactamase superfamily II)
MRARKYLFPNVIELNYQAERKLGVNVYLVDGGNSFVLIDIGYEDTVDEIIDLIRDMDFSLASCKGIVATHADVDHAQGLARARERLKVPVLAHPHCVPLLESGDRIATFASIEAQDIDLPMPSVKVDRLINEGDVLEVGDKKLTVWHTPGHAFGQLAFRTDNLLLSGDNIYKDGCVGAIDAHHGSDIEQFIQSLERIASSDAEYLLPSHGPAFRKEEQMMKKTIARLKTYLAMADFGTCAKEWPLLEQWEKDVLSGRLPKF